MHPLAADRRELLRDGLRRIADAGNDEWLQNLLAGWSGRDANALVSLILAESRGRKGLEDDCAVLVLHLSSGEKKPV